MGYVARAREEIQVGFVMERDPSGLDQHAPGAKLDDGKIMWHLLLDGMPNALEAVAKVATMGAKKYSPHGWKEVPDADNRYRSAHMRHVIDDAMGLLFDEESNELHLAHAAWNLLAVLQLRIERGDCSPALLNEVRVSGVPYTVAVPKVPRPEKIEGSGVHQDRWLEERIRMSGREKYRPMDKSNDEYWAMRRKLDAIRADYYDGMAAAAERDRLADTMDTVAKRNKLSTKEESK